METKNIGKIEENLSTILRLYNFIIQNYTDKSNPHQNEIIKEIIKSLHDPKAKVANRLSLSRIPLGAAIPITAYFTKSGLTTLCMTSLYAISDFLDGFYSKHIIKHPTKGGTYLDAACDKIGAIELITGAITKNPNIIINGILESIIAKTNTNATNKGINVHSTKLGKVKMWPLSAALICTYMSHTGFETKNFKISKENFNTAANILIPITAALEIVNIIEYNHIANYIEENEEITESKTQNQSKTLIKIPSKKRS